MFYILDISDLSYFDKNFIGSCYSNPRTPVINPGDILDVLCPDCNHDTCRGKVNNFNVTDEINYKFNNMRFRCDDLDLSKSENNFLFSGCSVTFGMGIPYSKTWAYQVNSHFGGESFFNIALPAGSFKSIVFDIFAYIRNYGKPKAVFVLFPPLLRQPVIENEKIRTLPYYRKDHSERSDAIKILNENTMMFEFSRLLGILEDHLRVLGVPFLWGTYEPEFDKVLSKLDISKNYVSVTNNPIAFNYANSIPEKDRTDYWLKSRDGHNPVIEHTMFAKSFIDRYNA